MISQISDATFGNDLVGKQNEITKKSFEKRKRKKNLPWCAWTTSSVSAYERTRVCSPELGKKGLNDGGGAQMARVNLERVSLCDEMVKSGWCN